MKYAHLPWEPSLQKELKRILSNEWSGHDYYHAERVKALALLIMRKEKIALDLEVLIAASWLHDVGYARLDLKHDKPARHIEKGLVIVKSLLNKVNFPKGKIGKVLLAVKHHDDKKSLLVHDYKGITKTRATNKELSMLSDADMVDGLGATNIARHFMYASSKGWPLLNRVPMNRTTAHSDFSSTDVFLSFHIQASKELHLEYSKKLANQRIRFVKRYVEEFSREIKELGLN